MSASEPRPSVDVRPSEGRFSTTAPGLDTRHSFSFGHHYAPGNTHHGVLLVNGEHRVQVGAGFPSHPHRDMEIVTWVLAGSLVHQDSAGRSGVVRPGLVQRMSAGTGVLHSETNDAAPGDVDRPREAVHFVQMWVVPDEPGGAPGYEQLDVDHDLRSGGLVPVASGLPAHDGAAGVRLGNRRAALHAARLSPGQSVLLPDAPYVHLFVPRGTVDVEGAAALGTGDAVRSTATGGQRVTATEPAELLVWEMHAGLTD